MNGLPNSHSGRPRPVQTSLFGGTVDFTDAGTLLVNVRRTCSFVSGEASQASRLEGQPTFALYTIAPIKRRQRAKCVAANGVREGHFGKAAIASVSRPAQIRPRSPT